MKRNQIESRVGWQKIVEGQGFIFHSLDNPYWNESAYYKFSIKQILKIESATNSLHTVCLEAVQHVINENRFSELGIGEAQANLIKQTWELEPPAIYGRFDLGYNGIDPPVMLEYNADTPTSLLEASVIQWMWLQDRFPSKDQFNSIHEKLLVKWRELKDYVSKPLYFSCMDTYEDIMTTSYLRDLAEQADIECKSILMADIGWDGKTFVDLENRPLKSIFKLYPWEWMYGEEFAQHLDASVQWIEPAWKAVLSNKGIMSILWELFPNHQNLLPTYRERGKLKEYVSKPLLSREGANVTIETVNWQEQTEGDYAEGDVIFQQYFEVPQFDGNFPIIGSWMIDQEAAGMGIRESSSRITDNVSRFVPHLIS